MQADDPAAHDPERACAEGPPPRRSTPKFRLETLKPRAAFRDAAAGRRYSTPAFTMLRRPGAAEHGLRFGFTVTKKLGNAVVRNRIRRRLREAVRAAAPGFPALAMDLVLLARGEALARDFAELAADVARAVAALAKPAPERRQTAGQVPQAGEKPRRDVAKLGKPPPVGIEGG